MTEIGMAISNPIRRAKSGTYRTGATQGVEIRLVDESNIIGFSSVSWKIQVKDLEFSKAIGVNLTPTEKSFYFR